MPQKLFFSVYFGCDNKVVTVPQQDITIRTNLEPFSEVDVRFILEKGGTLMYLGKILKQDSDNKKMDAFKDFAQPLIETLFSGNIDIEFLKSLTDTEESVWYVNEDALEKGRGQRKRVMTEAMREHVEQEEVISKDRENKTGKKQKTAKADKEDKENKSPSQSEDVKSKKQTKQAPNKKKEKKGIAASKRQAEHQTNQFLNASIPSVPGFDTQFQEPVFPKQPDTLMQQVKIPMSVQLDTVEPAEDPVTCVNSKSYTPATEITNPKTPIPMAKSTASSGIVSRNPPSFNLASNTMFGTNNSFQDSRFPDKEGNTTTSSIELKSTPVERSASLEMVTPKRTQLCHPIKTSTPSFSSYTEILESDFDPKEIKDLEELTPVNLPSLRHEINIIKCENKSLKDKLAQLEKENQQLKQELEKSQEIVKSSTAQELPVPPAVFSWMQNIVNGAPSLMNSSSIHYSVKANLHPTQSGKAKTQLLDDRPNIFVPREDLVNALSKAAKETDKNAPRKLLKQVIRMVFSPEELASSGGQGIKPSPGDKPELNVEKCEACKDYIRAYCAEREIDYPDTAAVNEAFTSQVAYSRRKLGLTGLKTK